MLRIRVEILPRIFGGDRPDIVKKQRQGAFVENKKRPKGRFGKCYAMRFAP
jgi:hypothetical protein